MAISPDPFTQTYGAIWDALEAHAELTALVKLGNRMKFDQLAEPFLKDSQQIGDTPALALLPAGGSFQIFRTNKGGSAFQAFQLGIISGEQRLQKQFFPVKWETIRALAIAGRTLGLEFVINVTIGDISEDLNDFATSLGIQGWTGQLEIQTELFFTKAELT